MGTRLASPTMGKHPIDYAAYAASPHAQSVDKTLTDPQFSDETHSSKRRLIKQGSLQPYENAHASRKLGSELQRIVM